MTTGNPAPRRDEASADTAASVGAPGPAVATAADAGEDGWWLALTDEDFTRQDEIWAIEQDAREAGRLPEIIPDDEDWGDGFDPDCAPPVTADWVPGMPWPEEGEPAPVPDLFPSDLLVRDSDPGRADGPPFAKGTLLDTAPPGPVLAGKLDHACCHGIGDVSDDQLAGMMLAATRQQSRATAQLLAAVSELARRREADPDPRVAAATDTEIAILLAVTRRSAGRLLGFATDLDQLPATRQALWDGRIDPVKAELIGYETGLLTPALAAAVEQLVIEDAARLTTTMLRARLRRAVIAADPAAARRRAAKARREAPGGTVRRAVRRHRRAVGAGPAGGRGAGRRPAHRRHRPRPQTSRHQGHPGPAARRRLPRPLDRRQPAHLPPPARTRTRPRPPGRAAPRPPSRAARRPGPAVAQPPPPRTRPTGRAPQTGRTRRRPQPRAGGRAS